LPFGSNVAFGNGYLFYVKDGTLIGQPFDPTELRFQGKPVLLAESIEYYDSRKIGSFSVAQNVLVYRQSSVQSRELVWLDATGKELERWGEPAPYLGGNMTPGGHLAVLIRNNLDANGNSLWLADTERKTITRLTPDSPNFVRGVVSANGRTLVTTTEGGGDSVQVLRSLASSGKEEVLAERQGSNSVQSQSRDGRYIFSRVQDAKTSYDIYSVDLAGDRKVTPVLNSPYDETDAKLSPDNKWLAYSSNENGQTELYVMPFPGGGSKWQVSSGGVDVLFEVSVEDWSPDGKSLYYRHSGKIYVVEVRINGDKPEFSAPKELMSIPQDMDLISILADGKRVLATRPVGQRIAYPQNLILNWQHLVR
jgi:dipeptidyl aminopeptidase/acylaminoacyl peptidase